MFRLIYIAIIRLTTKTKMKYSQLHVFEIYITLRIYYYITIHDIDEQF
jgi:hypothetical protein